MAQKNQSIGVTLISPLDLPTSDPRNPDYVPPTDGDGSDGSDGGDWLRIEQPPWPDEPEGGFAKWLQDNNKGLSLDTYEEYFGKYKSWCEESGELKVEIQVHKSRADLQYTLKTSYGTLSPGSEVTQEHVESQTISGADSYDIQKNVQGDVTATWGQELFAADGSPLTAGPERPKVTQSGSNLNFGAKVTGTLELKYSESHDNYTLTIPPRADADQKDRGSAYFATLFAAWSGGVATHEVNLPEMIGNCGGTENNSDDKKKPDGKCVRHNILVNPCTMEVIREWDENIECPDNSDAADATE